MVELRIVCLMLYFFNGIFVGFHLRLVFNLYFKHLSSLMLILNVVLCTLGFVLPLLCFMWTSPIV